MRRHVSLLARVLDQLQQPVFVFEGVRQVYANAAATDLTHRLRAHDRIELRVVLLDHISALEGARGAGPSAAPTVTLLTSPAGEPFYLRVWPITRRGSSHQATYAVSVRASAADVPAIRRRFRLTPREGQVAELVLRGWGNGEIARTLTMSVPTTKKHLGRIFDKVGVDSRSQLMAKLGY